MAACRPRGIGHGAKRPLALSRLPALAGGAQIKNAKMYYERCDTFVRHYLTVSLGRSSTPCVAPSMPLIVRPDQSQLG